MDSTSELIKLIFGGVISLASIAVAVMVYLIRRRQPWAQALFHIVNTLESDEIRLIRHEIIYKCPNDDTGGWAAAGKDANQTQEAIDKWGAYMDMLSLLYFTKQFNTTLFFNMYGDVIIRTAYKLAPYAYQQRPIRGEQFWLPFQELVLDLLKVWKKRSGKGKYPDRIGIPGAPDKVTREALLQNEKFRSFLQANSLKVK